MWQQKKNWPIQYFKHGYSVFNNFQTNNLFILSHDIGYFFLDNLVSGERPLLTFQKRKYQF